jgi:hypothetical protein
LLFPQENPILHSRIQGADNPFLTIWYYSGASSVFIFARPTNGMIAGKKDNFDLSKIFHMASNR